MKNRTNPSHINKIISISNQYINHRKNLTKVKGLVDHSNNSRNKDISLILARKSNCHSLAKYRSRSHLNQQNQKIVSRLDNISREGSLSRSSRRSTRYMQKTLSEQSLLCSKTRKNLKKSKQISEQNQKIAERILKSRFKDRIGPQSFIQSQRQNKQFKEEMGKYSQRSRSRMQIMLSNLKVHPNKVPFLPYIKSPNKNNYRKGHSIFF